MKMRMQLVEQSIAEYLEQLDRMDRKETPSTPLKAARLKDRIATLKDEMARLDGLKAQMEASPDGQVSLTDPDARSMASQGKGTGIVGYNVQTAVDAEHHLIVAHEVTNVGSDRAQLKKMADQAREALGTEGLTAVADRGYYSGEQIKACADAGMEPLVPKVMTSNSAAEGRYGKSDFAYEPDTDTFRCPAGQQAIRPDDECRARHGAQVLVVGMQALRAEGEVHDRRLPTDRALGARGRARTMQSRLERTPTR